MKLKIYAVYDSKIEAFNQPFYSRTRGEALRSWTDAVNRDTDPSGTNNFKLHSGDYSLFELGEFDDSSAKFHLHTAPISLGTALEFIRSADVVNLKGFSNA